MNRRSFLKNSSIGVMAAGMLSQTKWLNSEKTVKTVPPKIKEYRTLGRTGFKVSDISAGFQFDLGLLNALLDAGINYIDTAEEYGRGNSERTVGKALKNRDRKSLFVTTKLVLHSFTKEIDLTKEGLLARARKCLERLQTDYIDCLMIHSAHNVKNIKTEGFHEAVKQLKSEGRLRFCGISNHGSKSWHEPEESMEKILLAAAEDGRFDVIMVGYNFLNEDRGEKVLKACREKNIGTVLMKTNPVGEYLKMKKEIEAMEKEGEKISELVAYTFAKIKRKAEKAEGFMKKYNLNNPDETRDAAIRFVLSNPNVNTVCYGFKTFNDLEDYIKLSGSRLTAIDKKKLAAYAEGCGDLYCRHACGICESQCPNKVPVNTIMRYNHYFEAQGREKYAMVKYAELPTSKANLCQNCEGNCEIACPYDVPIHGLLILAHQRLTLV